MVCKYSDCANEGLKKKKKKKQSKKALKGLVIVTGVSPVPKDLTDVAVGPLLTLIAMVGGVWRGVWHLRLRRTILSVVEVKAVADVAEEPRRRFLLCRLLVVAVEQEKK